MEAGSCVQFLSRGEKISLPKSLVDRWGPEKVQQVIRYAEAAGTKVRNWGGYIKAALDDGWILDATPEDGKRVTPDVRETQQYQAELEQYRVTDPEEHQQVRELVDTFLEKVGSSREEVERQQRKAERLDQFKNQVGKGQIARIREEIGYVSEDARRKQETKERTRMALARLKARGYLRKTGRGLYHPNRTEQTEPNRT